MRRDVKEIDKYFFELYNELDKLPKQDNIVVDKDIVDFVPCPVCGSEDVGQEFVKCGFIYATCRKCSHMFVQNRIKEQVLLGLYSSSKADSIANQVSMSSAYTQYWGAVYKKYIDYVATLDLENKNLLDVGCGAGFFLNTASKYTDMDLYGLDFREDSYDYIVNIIGEKNYYYRQRIEDIDFGSKKFGLITLWGVLEHVVDPVSVVTKCSSVLAEGGMILFLFPNPNSRAIKILGINTPTLNPRSHVNMYSEKSFRVLCDKLGLGIVDRFQELPVIDLMYPYIHYTDQFVEDLVHSYQCYYDVYVVKAR